MRLYIFFCWSDAYDAHQPWGLMLQPELAPGEPLSPSNPAPASSPSKSCYPLIQAYIYKEQKHDHQIYRSLHQYSGTPPGARKMFALHNCCGLCRF